MATELTVKKEADKAKKEVDIPQAYVDILEEAREVTKTHVRAIRATATKYVPKMWKALMDAGISKSRARMIIDADCIEIGWAWTTVIHALPSDAKSARQSAAGKAGGKATKARRDARKKVSEKTAVTSTAPDPAASSDELAIHVSVDTWRSVFDNMFRRADRDGAKEIVLYIDASAEKLIDVDVVKPKKAVASSA